MSGTAMVVETVEADRDTNARHVARGVVWTAGARVIHLLTHAGHARRHRAHAAVRGVGRVRGPSSASDIPPPVGQLRDRFEGSPTDATP